MVFDVRVFVGGLNDGEVGRLRLRVVKVWK